MFTLKRILQQKNSDATAEVFTSHLQTRLY